MEFTSLMTWVVGYHELRGFPEHPISDHRSSTPVIRRSIRSGNRLSDVPCQDKLSYQLNVAKFDAKLQAEHSADTICPICLEDFKETEDVTILSCDHIFHLACVQRWVDREHTCPVCRKHLIEKQTAASSLQ